MIVQSGLCQTRSETTLLVFPRGGSSVVKPSLNAIDVPYIHMVICLFYVFRERDGIVVEL